MPTLRDDLGSPVALAARPLRLVSLVPSLTEALAVTVPELLVGVTDWCTHTAGLDLARVRGTKNPDHAAIGRLRPDLVIANREENRRVDVERLEESGIRVWVTVIDSVDEAFRLAPTPVRRCAGGRRTLVAGGRRARVAAAPRPARARVLAPDLARPLDGDRCADVRRRRAGPARAGQLSSPTGRSATRSVDLAALRDLRPGSGAVAGRALSVLRDGRARGVLRDADGAGRGTGAHLVRPVAGHRTGGPDRRGSPRRSTSLRGRAERDRPARRSAGRSRPPRTGCR